VDDTKTGDVITGHISFYPVAANNTGAPITATLQVTFPNLDPFTIKVTQDRARERYEISSVTVNGVYLPEMTMGDGTEKQYPLISGVHTLTVELKTNTSKKYYLSETAKWHVYSNEVNGYKFDSEGLFKDVSYGQRKTVGSYDYYTVKIQATVGVTPEKGGYDFFTLSTDGLVIDETKNTPSRYLNADGNDQLVRVLCGYRTMDIASYGYYAASTLGYAANKGHVKKMLDDPDNYGLDGTVPMEGFTQIAYAGGSVSVGGVASGGYATFFNRLKSTTSTPDIAIIGYAFNTKTSALAQELKDYINKGGVVILMCDGEPQTYATNIVNIFLRLFDSDASLGSGYSTSAGGDVYQLPVAGGTGSDQVPATSDYIANGPFGTVWGKYWGNDRTKATSVGNLTGNNNIVIYSRDAANGVTMFRLKESTLPRMAGLFFVGDGGFTARRNTYMPTDAIPFLTDAQNRPIVNPKFSEPVYNSIIFANAMFWAVDYAEFYGPNRTVNHTDYASWGK
jgi:hypothetical protein